MMVALLMVGGLALTGWIIYVAVQAEKKRKEALKLACQMMGFAWEDSAPADTLGEFALFGMGRGSKAECVSRGQLGGRPATIAEYGYVISTGKSSHKVNQTVVAFTAGDSGLPDFDLSPENVFHKLANVFGYQDIDFERFEEFSKRYLLRGQDEAAIRSAFTPDALMLLQSNPGWTVQSKNGRLLVFRAGKTTKPAELPIFAADALRIAGALSLRVPS